MPGSEQHGAVLEKNKEIVQDGQLPISLKKQVMDQCVLQQWPMAAKQVSK